MTNEVTTTYQATQLRKLLLTPEEAATVLGIGRTRVYQLIARGELAAIRIGTSRRIPFVALERFVDQLLQTANTEDTDGLARRPVR